MPRVRAGGHVAELRAIGYTACGRAHTSCPAAPVDAGAAMERPFRILGVQQIAVGATDKAALRRLWVDVLGIQVVGSYRAERENVDEDIAVVGRGAARVEIDLMQPIDPAKKPAVHDPALNHIGLWVDDLAAAVAWLIAAGVRFTPGGIRKGAAGHDVCFIHPKGNETTPIGGEGVLIELVQAPADVIAELAH
jgi:lactoylglutathione lyase